MGWPEARASARRVCTLAALTVSRGAGVVLVGFAAGAGLVFGVEEELSWPRTRSQITNATARASATTGPMRIGACRLRPSVVPSATTGTLIRFGRWTPFQQVLDAAVGDMNHVFEPGPA